MQGGRHGDTTPQRPGSPRRRRSSQRSWPRRRCVPPGSNAQAPSGRDFETIGGNLANHRYSSLTRNHQIQYFEVRRRLVDSSRGRKIARHHAGDADRRGGRHVHRLWRGQYLRARRRDGAIKWKHETTLGGTYRGVAVGEGKVFSGRRDNTLIALDQKTRRGRVEDAVGRSRPRNDERSRDLLRRPGLYRRRRRRRRRARPVRGLRREEPARKSGSSGPCPGPGERGHETWEGDSWKYGGGPVWTHPGHRSGSRHGVHADRECKSRQRRNGTRRRQSVHGVGRGARSQDRRVQVALPGSASRHLGLRQRGGAGPCRRSLPGIAPQGADAHEQDRVHVRPRSHKWQAARRHRRASRSAGAADEDRADAAISDRRFVRADLS